MSNPWYNPYDSGIQWGEGIADFVGRNKDMLMKIFGGGGGGRPKPGNQETQYQGMGQQNTGPIGAGGEGMGNQGQLMGDIRGGGFGSGSPAQYAGMQQGGAQSGQMTPEMKQLMMAIMEAMKSGGGFAI
jgi:hypothetical protein